jgi:hypothetical protein
MALFFTNWKKSGYKWLNKWSRILFVKKRKIYAVTILCSFLFFVFLNLFIEIKKYINHYKFKIAKNGKSVNNFATLRLIAYNDNMKVPTHITK